MFSIFDHLFSAAGARDIFCGSGSGSGSRFVFGAVENMLPATTIIKNKRKMNGLKMAKV
jgi:hypothetical protein